MTWCSGQEWASRGHERMDRGTGNDAGLYTLIGANAPHDSKAHQLPELGIATFLSHPPF